MQELQRIEVDGILVLTSKQLADCYGTTADIIGYNYRYNKSRYSEGKHYICLAGQALRDFKSTNGEIQRLFPRVNKLYLWTEKGTLLHAKSLNTDKAWEVYDYLVDFYFRAKETKPQVTNAAQIYEHSFGISEQVMAYNRGFILGVFKAELDAGRIGYRTVYEMLSPYAKRMIAMELLGLEVLHE